jgi:hypothetical protein
VNGVENGELVSAWIPCFSHSLAMNIQLLDMERDAAVILKQVIKQLAAVTTFWQSRRMFPPFLPNNRYQRWQ